MSEELVNTAMNIILHAGNARTHCMAALDAIAEDDYAKAETAMVEANTEIVEAHKLQTNAIQGEIRGETSESSLLMTHAQDTLMTVYSEINITKKMIKVFKNHYEK